MVVWKVVDTAEALFHVDDYKDFVHIQSESALRNMALSYPYDPHAEGEVSLRGHTAQVAEHLKTEIQERLEQAGVSVQEARISHLAYAPEIAHAMLQRQQAGAVISARQMIVEGAVGMVEMALDPARPRGGPSSSTPTASHGSSATSSSSSAPTAARSRPSAPAAEPDPARGRRRPDSVAGPSPAPPVRL